MTSCGWAYLLKMATSSAAQIPIPMGIFKPAPGGVGLSPDSGVIVGISVDVAEIDGMVVSVGERSVAVGGIVEPAGGWVLTVVHPTNPDRTSVAMTHRSIYLPAEFMRLQLLYIPSAPFISNWLLRHLVNRIYPYYSPF